MIAVKDALNQVLEQVYLSSPERISLSESLGRVLAVDVVSTRNIPPRDNSAMDGYALLSSDTKGASKETPCHLEIIEDIPAGYIPRLSVTNGKASRIMTGAPVPEGADTVVPLEDTEREGSTALILAETAQGSNIRLRGEDITENETVLKAGTLIGPAETGILASVGKSVLDVYRKPVVSIVATGDELVDLDGHASDDRIISSNSYALRAQIIKCGAAPVYMGIARDTKEDLREKLKGALQADVIISSAGVSVGDYDYVEEVIRELGVNIHFSKVAQRPGKPLVFGTAEEKLFFGLPGNPVSTMLTFEQYVRPALLKMTGRSRPFRRTVKATLLEEVKKKKGLRYFVRAVLAEKNGEYTVTTTGAQGSGILMSMVKANGIIVLPEDMVSAKKGEEVTVQVLDPSFEELERPEHLE